MAELEKRALPRMRLEAVPDAVSEPVTVQDGRGNVVYANDAAARLLGYESGSAMVRASIDQARSRYQLLDDDGMMLTFDQLPARRVTQGEQEALAVIKFRDSYTQAVRWVEIHSTAMIDAESGVRLAVNVLRDATEQVRLDRERAFLIEAGTMLSASLDYDATLRRLAELTVPEIADWCAVYTYTGEQQVRQVAAAHVDPAKLALTREIDHRTSINLQGSYGVAGVLRTGEPELIHEIPDELLVPAAHDTEVPVLLRDLGLRSSMCLPLLARGRTLGAILMVSADPNRLFDEHDLDVAADLAARAALAADNAQLYQDSQRSSRELTAVLSQMADAVMIADAWGVVTFANDAAHRLMGRVILGVPVADSRPDVEALSMDGRPMDSRAYPLADALMGAALFDLRWRARHPDGREAVIQSTAVPLIAPDGSPMGAVAVSRDITSQHDFEEQKDRFFRLASHDLKNPLTVIKGIAQMLRLRVERTEEPDAQLISGLKRIDSTSTRMTGVINQLLDATRLEAGRPLSLYREPVDLVELVAQIAREQDASSRTHSVVFDSSVPELQGQWDRARLERVISNLLSNAVKFSPRGGEVLVRISTETHVTGVQAIISVADHGIGIPADDVDRIFTQCARGANASGRIDGSGIGLAGVKHIVEQHGGCVDVHNRENVGSTFTVRLPVQPLRKGTGGSRRARE
jgi:PAS domain S-box-containing protein